MHSMDEVWRPAIPGRGEEKGEGEAKRREKETPSSPFIFLSFFYCSCTLPACISMNSVHAWYWRKPEEGTRSS